MKNLFLFIFVFSPVFNLVYAQGCSDAGFCTIDALKPNGNDSIQLEKNQLKIAAFIGGADHSILTWGNYIEYNRRVSERFGFDAKLTSLAQSGNDISAFGLGDVFLSGNYKVNNKIKVTLGAKVPLTDGNRKENGSPLPMDYQSSLGTFDLIAGIGYQIKRLQLTFALQQPLSQNENEFIAENYPVGSPLAQFQSTNKFNRKGDVLLRASYPVQLAQNLTLVPSLLPIYHLSEDSYTDGLGIERKIEGSEGLTLNGNVYLDYELNPTSALQLSLGVPFIVRDVRPDGLTRSFVANIEYRIRF